MFKLNEKLNAIMSKMKAMLDEGLQRTNEWFASNVKTLNNWWDANFQKMSVMLKEAKDKETEKVDKANLQQNPKPNSISNCKTKVKSNKPMAIMLISLGILFGLVFGYKAIMNLMIKKYMSSHSEPTVTVAAMKADYSSWQPLMRAPGTLRAIKGVDVTTELAGLVRTILFTPGQYVKKGDILVELTQDADVAQLHALEATADLAQIVYDRDKAQFEVQAVSKATLDADAANLKNARALVDQQAATVAKKTLRAPFDGRLGISVVNPGQFLNPGDKTVTLQSLDPIYVDFTLPQQALLQIKVGDAVEMTTDAFPSRVFKGKLTTIDPKIDPTTRNIQVEATFENPDMILLPGMYGNVTLQTGTASKLITLPQTAISYNPYGDIAYIIKESDKKDKKGNPILIVNQIFVTVGEKRGDQVSIIKGLKEGDWVVVAGQNKLRNGSKVTINNSVLPANDPAPKPVNQ